MPLGNCHFASDYRSLAHTRYIDDEGICTYCGSIIARIRRRIAAGELFPPDVSNKIGDKFTTEPSPRNSLAACAACGERFNSMADQQPFLGKDGKWRFVHRGLCFTLMHFA
jgi:hypothetical protein